jgi:hypothetical protein
MPTAEIPVGSVTVIAGKAAGVKGKVEMRTAALYLYVTLERDQFTTVNR